MRRLITLIMLLVNTLMAFAQNGVKGRVVEADGTPVIYAAVLMEFEKKTVTWSMTETDGTFKPAKGAQKNQEEDRSIIRLGN